ncbi:hypothetical protein MESMUL_21710 [Mesosutterella multiformis]|uniref:Uncharacterized protein n=1 Tax=Mesosutterella multiformis TaxID=2259133 RepID=A0A388SEM5_9BURK|nr:hypothetical protein MESMUL_21710 [Mesosutterella multiformis]
MISEDFLRPIKKRDPALDAGSHAKSREGEDSNAFRGSFIETQVKIKNTAGDRSRRVKTPVPAVRHFPALRGASGAGHDPFPYAFLAFSIARRFMAFDSMTSSSFTNA